ncbi:MAG: asparagine synthetase B [Candidatus Kapabacteria bacterium]|jgi:hypothetical protein|nr:asparagine synthetase B [Candidatus Kapabacteria bacterium]
MKKLILILFAFGYISLQAEKILIPMDLTQTNHLKAYGVAFWIIKNGQTVDWLLNYRGGSFMADASDKIASECRIRGVSFESLSEGSASAIIAEVKSEDKNMDVVKLEKVPKIAIYAPPGSLPWDDAVRLALEYAEVDHTVIYDEEVINGKLKEYDWVHLHHEDFTGQYSKFFSAFANAPWYIQQVAMSEGIAKKLGFNKVSELKRAVVLKMREFIANGGYLFAMCNGTDTFDISLATQKTDICEQMYDGDGADPNANNKLDYTQTLAFENFRIDLDPYGREFSDIDTGPTSIANPENDYFTLFDFSAKYDPVPTMLTQNHVNLIQGFVGVTTNFRKSIIKKSVILLAQRDGTDEVRYIHGNFGRGTFTWFSGHDPEDYTHHIGDPTTDLNLHKRSPGYRLILNNILFPAAKKKQQKT